MSRSGPFEKEEEEDDVNDNDDDGVSTAVAEPRGPGSVRDGEEEKDVVVERSGWRRRRRHGGNDDGHDDGHDGQRYEFGATHGNALIGHVVSKEEMAAMATSICSSSSALCKSLKILSRTSTCRLSR